MRLIDVPSVDNRGVSFVTVPQGEQPNVGNDVTADRALRRALNVVVDRSAIAQGALAGYGSPAYTNVSELPWENEASHFEDGSAEQARQYLREGGWTHTDGAWEKDGVRAEFSLVYPASDETRQALALAFAQAAQSIDVRVNVEAGSWEDIESRMHSDAVMFGWGSLSPIETYSLYHSDNAGNGWYNTGYYASDTVDAHLDRARRAATEAEAHRWLRLAQYDEGAGYAGNADAPWAWLVNIDHLYWVSECLDIGVRVEPHGHGWPITWDIQNWKYLCE